ADACSCADGLSGRGYGSVRAGDGGGLGAPTSAGLALLQGPAHPVRAVSPGTSSHESPVYAIAHDSRGRTWIAGESGLAILDGDQRVALSHLPAALANETSWTLVPDPRGSMWVGTRRDGVLRVDVDTGQVLERHAAGEDVRS